MVMRVRKRAKPLLGERLARIDLCCTRGMMRMLTNKVTGPARSERHRVAEIYSAMRRDNSAALEEAYRFHSTAVFVRDKVRRVRAGVIASSPGMVCTGAEPQQHAKVGDLWNPRRDDEDDYSLAVRLKVPGGGAFVFSESATWIPLTDETQHLVGKWGRDAAQRIDSQLEVADAKVTLARSLWGVVLAHFERQLQLTPLLDDKRAFASANHALFELTEELGGKHPADVDRGRLQRVFVSAQAEWRRLALSSPAHLPETAGRKGSGRRKRRRRAKSASPAKGVRLHKWERRLISILIEDLSAGKRAILDATPGELARRLTERHEPVLTQAIAPKRISKFIELRAFLASDTGARSLPATFRASLGTELVDAIEECLKPR